MLAILIICAIVTVAAPLVLLRRLRAQRRADIAAQAWADGACMRRADYNSGPPRPVPPEAP